MNEKLGYTIQVTVEVPQEEWRPGLMVGTEGYKPTIVHVDMENRKLTLEYSGIIIDGRSDE